MSTGRRCWKQPLFWPASSWQDRQRSVLKQVPLTKGWACVFSEGASWLFLSDVEGPLGPEKQVQPDRVFVVLSESFPMRLAAAYRWTASLLRYGILRSCVWNGIYSNICPLSFLCQPCCLLGWWCRIGGKRRLWCRGAHTLEIVEYTESFYTLPSPCLLIHYLHSEDSETCLEVYSLWINFFRCKLISWSEGSNPVYDICWFLKSRKQSVVNVWRKGKGEAAGEAEQGRRRAPPGRTVSPSQSLNSWMVTYSQKGKSGRVWTMLITYFFKNGRIRGGAGPLRSLWTSLSLEGCSGVLLGRELIPGWTGFAFWAQYLKYFLSIRLPPINSLDGVASVESNLIVESRQGWGLGCLTKSYSHALRWKWGRA